MMRERQQLDEQIGAVERLEWDLADLVVLIELGLAVGDKAMVAEA